MRGVQQLIKIFALCLAGVIILSMVAAVFGAISLVSFIGGAQFSEIRGETTTIWQDEEFTTSEINQLVVKSGASSVKVIRSSSSNQTKVETNNDYFEVKQNDGTLRVEERSHFSFSSFGDAGELIITLPKDNDLKELRLELGAGAVLLEDIKADQARMELGAGKATIKNLEVKDSVKIKGGAGKLEVLDSKLHDADLEIGAGRAEIAAKITGDSKIESGLGSLELKLLDKKEKYRFIIDKGIGSVQINGSQQSDGATFGDGENKIRIESGMGSVEIFTSEN